MLIHDPKLDLTRSKEVKVKIPVSHHIKLHSMKVLTGKQISDAITEALDAYFASGAYQQAVELEPDALRLNE
ncbi:MAG: hypothetical protein WDA16_11510 [Candidatus Thermoplasmatota archaeon]